jgi:hypothetical protein
MSDHAHNLSGHVPPQHGHQHAHGQNHEFVYPYQQQPQTFVPADQLAPVAVPQQPAEQVHQYAPAPERPMPELPQEQLYYAPVAPPRDQARTTLAAVITFIGLVVALWGILGFLSAMSRTLSSVDAGTTKLKGQLITANVGLHGLDEKTGHLDSLATDSTALKTKLGAIDTGMASMLTSIDLIASNMTAMGGSLGTLDTELGKLNDANGRVGQQLGEIRVGLDGQNQSVGGMAKDVNGTAKVLSQLPPRLAASNARLKHINSVVNYMGCTGILQKLHARFYLGPISNGSGDISATIVPPGAWGSNADGSKCQ